MPQRKRARMLRISGTSEYGCVCACVCVCGCVCVCLCVYVHMEYYQHAAIETSKDAEDKRHKYGCVCVCVCMCVCVCVYMCIWSTTSMLPLKQARMLRISGTSMVVCVCVCMCVCVCVDVCVCVCLCVYVHMEYYQHAAIETSKDAEDKRHK